MSKSYWLSKQRDVEKALAHARDRRMCLTAVSKTGKALLERRVRDGVLLTPFPGVYEEPDYWPSLDLREQSLRVIRSAALLHPEWVFCETSAAIAHGLEVSCPQPGVVHIATSSTSHSQSTVRVARHPYDGASCSASGVSVTPIERCVFDCARNLDARFALAVTDSYARRASLTPASLLTEFERVGRGLKGIRRAEAVARITDGRAENGGESVARGTMVELGFAPPELQACFPDPMDPGHAFRVDFFWPKGEKGLPIIGELDGLAKYTMPDARALDLEPTSTYTAYPDADPYEYDGRAGEKSLHTALRNLSKERQRESRLTLTGAAIMRFDFETVLDERGFESLLDDFGVPRAL